MYAGSESSHKESSELQSDTSEDTDEKRPGMDVMDTYTLRFTTSVSGWIVIWGSNHEFHIFTLFHTGQDRTT